MSLSLMSYYCLLDQTSQLMSKTDYTQLKFFIELKKHLRLKVKHFLVLSLHNLVTSCILRKYQISQRINQ